MKPSINSGHANDFVPGTNHEDGHAEGISTNLKESTSQESVDQTQIELDKEAQKPESE